MSSKSGMSGCTCIALPTLFEDCTGETRVARIESGEFGHVRPRHSHDHASIRGAEVLVMFVQVELLNLECESGFRAMNLHDESSFR
jgi:hypothetical protein